MAVPSYAVRFRGRWACPCQAEWIPAYEHELQRRGILKGPIGIFQLIGTYAASADTHAFGGASDFIDIPNDGDEAVWVARQMGADPTWHRMPGWDNGGGVEHDHSVLRGCPHALRSTIAANQISAVDDGYNGLGHLGRGGKDNGPRPLSGRTWQQGIAWARAQEDDMPAPKDWDDADWKAIDQHIWGRPIKAVFNMKASAVLAAIAKKLGVQPGSGDGS